MKLNKKVFYSKTQNTLSCAKNGWETKEKLLKKLFTTIVRCFKLFNLWYLNQVFDQNLANVFLRKWKDVEE